MECTLSDLSQEYFNMFMSNMMIVLGQVTGGILSAGIIFPVYAFYTGKLSMYIDNLKTQLSALKMSVKKQ
jgi:hypothetical protein